MPRRCSPSARRASRARSSVECRQRSASRGGLGHRVGQHRQHEALGVPERVAVVARARSGPWTGWRGARRGRRPAARGTARSAPPAAARGRPRPRRRRRPRSRRGTRAARATSPSQPASRAPASAAATWSRTAGAERRLDQPYARSFTSAAARPGCSVQVTVSRAQSSRATTVSRSRRPGASTTWSIPAPMSSPLRRCGAAARRSGRRSSCETASQRAVEHRRDPRVGRQPAAGSSFATSSDCRMTRTGRPPARPRTRSRRRRVGSNETSRRERTWIRLAAGRRPVDVALESPGAQVEPRSWRVQRRRSARRTARRRRAAGSACRW